uniref:Smr domain-containing protein n=1 Tax=Anopheles minimus TaxID=112268 RepID=A0A182VWS6_9DIPT
MYRDEILAHLTEMFGDHIDQQRIIATIEKYDDVNACVEALLKDEEQCASFPELKTTADKLPIALPTGDNDSINGPDRSTGATRKLMNIASNDESQMTASFASLLQKGSFPTQFPQSVPSNNGQKLRGTGKHQPAEQQANFQNILDMVAQGYRVMVLMRGAPGSGKSYLARTLIDHTSEGDYRNHIFSADDYFMVNEVYKFQPDALDAAHRFNQQNVLAKARDGWSPIVVDNTHIRLWEMFEYVKIAAAHGYFLEVLEPMTYWRNSSRSLAIRNTHGVPEPKIKSMLQNFEKLTNVQELYRLCKLEHALYIQVKMRHYPILPSDLRMTGDSKPVAPTEDLTNSVPQGTKWSEPWADIQKATKDNSKQKTNDRLTDLSAIPPPKPPRDLQKIGTPVKEASHQQKTNQDKVVSGTAVLDDDGFSSDLPDDWCKTDTNWKPYDTESNQFWGQATAAIEEKQKKQMQTTDVLALEAQPQRTINPHHEPITEFLLSSVKEPTKLPMKFPELSLKTPPSQAPQPAKEKPSKKTDMKRIALTKHKRGCPNENTSFSEICNLYPNVPESDLWDLFEKCGGDGDWVANILLEEQKSDNFESFTLEASQQRKQGELVDALTDTTFRWNLLDCNCNEQIAKGISPSISSSLFKVEPETTEQTAALNMTTGLSGYQSPRETIRRGQGQRKATQSIKKEIEARFVLGNEHFSQPIQKLRLARRIVTASDESPPGEMLDMETTDKATDSEVVELQLGVELVQQLHAIFKDKHCPKSLELDNLQSDRTRVFMATEMAEQLYLLFLDSLYSYTEEEKLLSLREDARMAQMMQTEEKYPALFKPPNPSGIPNLKDIIEMEEALAAYQKETNATWQKPGSPDLAQQMSQQKLKEMFPHVNGEDLVQILAAHHNRFDETVQVLNASIPDTVRQQMLEKEELLKQRAENEKQKLLDLFSSPTYASPSPTGSSGEEAINFHLIKAEEYRNSAQQHLDLKNECHEKARQAIQRNLPGLVDYYSQIARLHRTKIDMYNSRASNCIMEVHKLKLNNDAVLDLHYLHSQEALGCLELFLAEHASNLLNSQQRYKTLYIITGRGLHSADGKPIIKQRVKALLRVKNIRYTELNPGFLKIKLYNRNDLEQLMVAD